MRFVTSVLLLLLGLPLVLLGEEKSEAEAPAPDAARNFGITPYEPIYFSVGFNEFTNARFQISLKFRPLGPQDDEKPGSDWWEDLYAGFTQTSVWDLQSESKPFFDSSYKPSLFWYRSELADGVLGGRLGLAGGFEHESNGKGGTDSRSINMLFIRPMFSWGDPKRWQLTFSPKFYVYVEKSDNPDIAEFRGYGDYQVSLEHQQRLKVSTTLRLGTGGHGSLLVDASYPLRDLLKVVRYGYLHLQYFNGYGETLRNYNDRGPWQIRLGLMLVR